MRSISFELRANVVNALDETAAIDFELGLAGTPGADATGLLGERATRAAKTRQAVLEQRELDLGLAFRRARVLGEDVENDRRAVDRRAPEDLLKVALLGRREVVLEDHGVGVNREAISRNSRTLPEPMNVAGSGLSRRWTTRATTSAPAVSTSSASSSS